MVQLVDHKAQMLFAARALGHVLAFTNMPLTMPSELRIG